MLLDGKPVLLLCSNNYLGLADHPRVREAAAEAAMRWGVGVGRVAARCPGNMTIHRRLEEQLADFKGARRRACCSAPATSPTPASSRRSPREGDVVFSDALNHASIIDGCRLSRAETFVYDHCDIDHLEWGLRQAERARRADRHRRRVLDGRRHRAAARRSSSSPQRYDARVMVDEAHGIGARRARRARLGGRGRPRGRGRRGRRARSARRSAPTARTRCCDAADGEVPRSTPRAR